MRGFDRSLGLETKRRIPEAHWGCIEATESQRRSVIERPRTDSYEVAALRIPDPL